MGLGFTEILLIIIVFFLLIGVTVIPFWKIYEKAGYSPWLSLLQLLPVVNIVMLYVLAFSEWPMKKRTGELP